jgi:hypothetical protein
MAGRDAFVSSLYVNVLFGLFFLLCFCLLRTRLPSIYSPRERVMRGSQRPPALPPGLFDWIRPLMRLEERTLTASAGLDATMYLRFLHLSFQLFAVASVFGCGIVLPVNLYYDNLYYAELDDGTVTMADTDVVTAPQPGALSNISRPLLDRLSMTHMRDASPMLWLHFTFVYFLTAYALSLIHENFRGFADLRHDSMLRDRQIHHRWILVDNIPLDLREEDKLFDYFKAIYPHTLASVILVRNTAALDKMIEERDAALHALEHALAQQYRRQMDQICAEEDDADDEGPKQIAEWGGWTRRAGLYRGAGLWRWWRRQQKQSRTVRRSDVEMLQVNTCPACCAWPFDQQRRHVCGEG